LKIQIRIDKSYFLNNQIYNSMSNFLTQLSINIHLPILRVKEQIEIVKVLRDLKSVSAQI
jgi:hypothetical protein